MAWRQQDYILRLIEQVGAAIQRAFGLRDTGAPEIALYELRAAVNELLGPAAPLVSQVDVETAINIVGDPQRLALLARLLAAEADIQRTMEDDDAAGRLRHRAIYMARAAAARDEGMQEQISDLLRELED